MPEISRFFGIVIKMFFDVKVIETPAGQSPFRTIVDKMGMGNPIEPYNEHLEKVTSGIYSAFGIGHMRQLKTRQ